MFKNIQAYLASAVAADTSTTSSNRDVYTMYVASHDSCYKNYPLFSVAKKVLVDFILLSLKSKQVIRVADVSLSVHSFAFVVHCECALQAVN